MEQLGRIFVSYARANSKTVFPILDKLRADGFNFWVDQEGIEGASFWRKEIVEAIDLSPVVLFFVSQESCLSENVSKELALASEGKKSILPVFIDQVRLPSDLRYQIAGLQQINWYEDPERAYLQIKIALSRLTNKQSVIQQPQQQSTNWQRSKFRAPRLFPSAIAFVILTLGAVVGWYKFEPLVGPKAREQEVGPSDKIPTRMPGAVTDSVGTVTLKALVIGNQSYKNAFSSLSNPATDARNMSDLLERRGFSVTQLIDGTSDKIRATVKEYYSQFSRTRGVSIVRIVNNPVVFFVYYAGHAVAIQNEPFIVPVDIDGSAMEKEEVRQQLIPFSELIPTSNGIKATNRLILYATSPGGLAMDGGGDQANSPFTSALLEHMRNDNLDIFSIFTQVTKDVRKKTDGHQTPWIEGSLESPLFFGKLKEMKVDDITSIAILDSCRTSPFPVKSSR